MVNNLLVWSGLRIRWSTANKQVGRRTSDIMIHNFDQMIQQSYKRKIKTLNIYNIYGR